MEATQGPTHAPAMMSRASERATSPMLELTRGGQPADVTPAAVLAGMAGLAEVALLRRGRSGLASHAAAVEEEEVAFWWAEK